VAVVSGDADDVGRSSPAGDRSIAALVVLAASPTMPF
jgi:hypothetical protein